MVSTSELVALGKAVGTEFSEKNVTFIAGSIAYSAFVSWCPSGTSDAGLVLELPFVLDFDPAGG